MSVFQHLMVVFILASEFVNWKIKVLYSMKYLDLINIYL